MAEVTIYHNPRCSKSRQTLALLQARGIEPTIVEYLETPPSPVAIERLLSALDISAHALVRTKEAPYAELGLGPASTDAKLIEAMASHPILIERPIVVVGERAALGRPPENVLELL